MSFHTASADLSRSLLMTAYDPNGQMALLLPAVQLMKCGRSLSGIA